jgi:hypothetical protein
VPTAYLSPSQLKELTDVSVNPGSGQDGYPLVWNNTTNKWEASNAFTGTLTGSATSLATGRTISATGDISWTSGAFNGTANVTGTAALATIQGLSPGTYTNANVTVDTKGRVTAVSSGADIDPQVTLPLATNNGGTGTQTGSITGTGALTFAAGGTNQNVNITPSGSGELVVSGQALRIIQPVQNTSEKGINFSKSGNDGFFSITNGISNPTGFIPYFYAKTTFSTVTGITTASLNLIGLQSPVGDSVNGVCYFAAYNTTATGPINGSHKAFTFQNYLTLLLDISGAGDTRFYSTTESTSTTNGAVRIDGGVGIAKNLNVGGDKINFANLPTSEPATVGDLWRDGNVIKVKI